MIKFLEVHGEVLVEDVIGGYNQMAEAGLELSPLGNYLIATTETSSAKILIHGHPLDLQKSSFLRVHGDQVRKDRHTALWGGNVKLFLGRIWAFIDNDNRWSDDGANAAVGVRG